MAPVEAPKQLTWVTDVEITMTGGWLMVAEVVAVQPLASVTVTV